MPDRRSTLAWLRNLVQHVHDGTRLVAPLTVQDETTPGQHQVASMEATLTLAVRQGDATLTHTLYRVSLDGPDAMLVMEVERDDPDNRGWTVHTHAADRIMPPAEPETVRLVLVGDLIPLIVDGVEGNTRLMAFDGDLG